MEETLRNLLVDLLAPPGIEATIESLVNTCALAVAGKPADVRAGAVKWLRNEIVDDMSKLDQFLGKDLTPLVDFFADRLTKRIAEIEAIGSGRA